MPKLKCVSKSLRGKRRGDRGWCRKRGFQAKAEGPTVKSYMVEKGGPFTREGQERRHKV